jgi:hypothetical protein
VASSAHGARDIQARLLQFELEKKQAKLLDADEVRRVNAAGVQRARDAFTAMVKQMPPDVWGLPPAEAAKKLQEEIERVLDELSGQKPSRNEGSGE